MDSRPHLVISNIAALAEKWPERRLLALLRGREVVVGLILAATTPCLISTPGTLPAPPPRTHVSTWRSRESIAARGVHRNISA